LVPYSSVHVDNIVAILEYQKRLIGEAKIYVSH